MKPMNKIIIFLENRWQDFLFFILHDKNPIKCPILFIYSLKSFDKFSIISILKLNLFL